MSTLRDLTIDRQDDETFRITLVDIKKVPISLSGMMLQFQVFPDKNCLDHQMMLEVNTPVFDENDPNAAAGVGDITIPSADTDFTERKLYYKFRLIGIGGSPITTIMRGKLLIVG